MAYEFDGSNDSISYGHLSEFDGLDKVTISAWIYPIATDFYDAFFAQMASGGANGFEILNESADEDDLFISFRNGGTTPQKAKRGILTPSAWNHIWIVYDGTQASDGDRVKLWVGGSAVTSWDIDTGSWPTTIGNSGAAALTIGAEDGSLYNNCRVADVGFLIGRTVTDGTIASCAGGQSIGFYVVSGDLWMKLLYSPDDINDSHTGTVSGATIVAGPSLTYPGVGGQPFAKRWGGVPFSAGRPHGGEGVHIF
jgi:hypothetical protein